MPQTPSDIIRRRPLPVRILIWTGLILLVTVLAVMGSLTLICVYKPDIVAARVQILLNDNTGLPWRIRGSIRPSLRGGPGIVAKDVRILAATADQGHYANAARPLVHAEALRVYLDLLSLFRLEPMFELVQLEKPTVNLVYDSLGRPLWLPPDDNEPEPDPAFTVKSDSAITFKSVADAVCAPYHMAMQPLVIKDGAFVSYTTSGEVLLAFSGIEGRFDPDADGENLNLSAAFSLPDAGLAIRFAVGARVGCEDIPAIGNLNGQLTMTPPGSRPIEATFASSFTWQANGKDISLPDFSLRAENDLLTADLNVDLAAAACTGPVTLHGISMPRWFEWARVLPPGLQQALHSMTGSFNLAMTGTGAEARDLQAEAGPLRVKGSVATPDFSKPAVVVQVTLEGEPDLDPIFPFLGVAGRSLPEPVAPVFDHPPLAPYPEDPPAPYDPGPSFVGYDINVFVPKATVHGITGGPLTVRVFPHMVGPVEKTRVAITATNLMGGSADGHLDIDRAAILMRYNVKGMDLALLPENQGSNTQIAGKATGLCEIDMPMNDKGLIIDDWPLRVDATVDNCVIKGKFQGKPWHLALGAAKAKGAGSIHAVLKEGVRIGGDWSLDAKKVAPSWNTKGNDALAGSFKGSIDWPPILGLAPKPGQKPERKTVDKVSGAATAKGGLGVPLGGSLIPLKGALKTRFDWDVRNDKLSLQDAEFEGHGSVFEGDFDLDMSGKNTQVKAMPVFKIRPDRLLRDWGVAAPAWIKAPGLLSGRFDALVDGFSLALNNIKVEADGAPISGSIARAPTGLSPDNGNWTVRLAAEHLDLEKIFPPQEKKVQKTPPARDPWNLTFMQGMVLDAEIVLNKARKGKLAFDRSRIVAALQRDRFSLECDTGQFYGGTSMLHAQGTVLPQQSQVTVRKGLARMQNVSLGALLYDLTGERSYAGTTELVADISGVLGASADIPSKLSGNWSLTITDGLYPGFLTSEDSTLRNTFSLATASGPLDRGVLRSNNFKLTGALVDMTGGGWYDLNTQDMDIDLSVTIAKIPTVPVRFYGNASAPRMKVRGVDMVVETAQAAGSTVFGLVKGILELPGQAIRGIGNLFGGNSDKNKNKRPPQTMPVRPSGR